MTERRADRPDETGFTLVELLVVIVVLAVLTAVAVPLYVHQREKARDAVLRTEVKRLADAVQAALLEDDPATLMVLSARDVEGQRRLYLMRGGIGVGQEELGRLDPEVDPATLVGFGGVITGGLTVLGTAGSQDGLTTQNWCVDLRDRQTGHVIRYSAEHGMEPGRCTDPA